MHLPAAGLLERKIHLDSQTLEQANQTDAHLGKQRIIEAGDEKCDAHGLTFTGWKRP
ncbi:MAG: hypothetical protein ACLQUY_11175 [Ktedonobacterales bacterium]